MASANERSQEKNSQAVMGGKRVSVPRGQHKGPIVRVRTVPPGGIPQADDQSGGDQLATDEQWQDIGCLLPEKDQQQQVDDQPQGPVSGVGNAPEKELDLCVPRPLKEGLNVLIEENKTAKGIHRSRYRERDDLHMAQSMASSFSGVPGMSALLFRLIDATRLMQAMAVR